MRLQAGLREPAYEASVRRMLAGGLAGEESDASSVSLPVGKVEGEVTVKNEKGQKVSSSSVRKEKNPVKVLLAGSSLEENEKEERSEMVVGVRESKNSVDGGEGNEEQEGPTETEDIDEEDKEGNDDNSKESDSDTSDDENSENGEGEDGWVERKGADGKYRKQLPARDDPEARKGEKDARKEARKVVKEESAKKRQEKVPKHVKKRAVKAGKKK